ncbi:hypothetical protein [Vibrio mediterranei]|uniref:hypothetical protein n=1 Tax=Vibrio mediterranei TaxID=689 RepID=UPI00148BBFE5|nr:hypothetical protein [Vibrio mediterranei]NOH30960.1 hypothetical protein [Vibrio mediterranei]
MKAKKALKKLKKKSVKAIRSRSLEQLQLLKFETKAHDIKKVESKPGWSSEIKDVANDAAISALSELAAPLSPVLSWLNGGGQGNWSSTGKLTAANARVSSKPSSNKPNISSIASLPLKSPPCKRCPALSYGICKCAAKRFKLTA